MQILCQFDFYTVRLKKVFWCRQMMIEIFDVFFVSIIQKLRASSPTQSIERCMRWIGKSYLHEYTENASMFPKNLLNFSFRMKICNLRHLHSHTHKFALHQSKKYAFMHFIYATLYYLLSLAVELYKIYGYIQPQINWKAEARAAALKSKKFI